MSALSLVASENLRTSAGSAAARPLSTTRPLAVLACMDDRIDPARLLGFARGEAYVLRNAGGRVSDDIIRSLAVAQQLFGTREIAVIHHRDCEMQCVAPERFRALLREELGADATSLDLMAFDDVECSVHQDLRALRHSPLLRSCTVRGYVYDVQTDTITEVR